MVVLTLADRRDAFGAETEQVVEALSEAKRVSARQERVITPTAETEIAAIVCHRLFRRIDEEAGRETAAGYAAALAKWSEQKVGIPAHATRAEYSNGIIADYPLHPELLNTLNRKTSTIPSFQKTRGALRLLAQDVRALWEKKPADTWLIHAHHLDLGVDDIAADLMLAVLSPGRTRPCRGRGWRSWRTAPGISTGTAAATGSRASLQIPDRAGAPRRPAAKARRKCLYLLVPVLRRNAGSGDGSVMPATWSEFVGKLSRRSRR